MLEVWAAVLGITVIWEDCRLCGADTVVWKDILCASISVAWQRLYATKDMSFGHQVVVEDTLSAS